jgi:hypothetical protein
MRPVGFEPTIPASTPPQTSPYTARPLGSAISGIYDTLICETSGSHGNVGEVSGFL